MYIIQTVSAKQFSLDGIPYFKNYISRVTTNGKLSIFNCYDSRDVLVEFTDADQFEVNGVTYTDVAALQAALINVLYTRGGSGGGSVGDLQEVTENGNETNTGIVLVDEFGNKVRLDGSEDQIVLSGISGVSQYPIAIISKQSIFFQNGLRSLFLKMSATGSGDYIFPATTSEEQVASREWVQPQVQSANFTAENGRSYHTVATCTVTDPTPVEGKGFEVLVVNGTATVGGTAYNVVGTVIKRVFHSGAWSNRVYITQAAINTALVGKANTFLNVKIPTTTYLTGTTVETEVYRLPIPPNTFSAIDMLFLRGFIFQKIGTAAAYTIRMKLSTSQTMPSGTTDQIGTMIPTNTNISAFFGRGFAITAGNLIGLIATLNSSFETNTGNALLNVPFDHTVTQYLYISITLGNANDQVRMVGGQISNV